MDDMTRNAEEGGGFGLLFEAVERLGLQKRVIDPTFGWLWEISDGNGWRQPIVGLRLPLNHSAASHLASDKHYASLVLAEAGFRVPRTARALAPRAYADTSLAEQAGPEPALEFAREHGFPLIVKPNRLSHGRGVELVTDEAELRAALERVFSLDAIALTQEVVNGAEYRLEFLDGEYLIGYERAPTQLVGDGLSTVVELLAALDPRFARERFLARLERAGALPRRLRARGLSLQSVLRPGETLAVEDTVLNLSRGATPRLVDVLPPGWDEYGRRAGRALGLRHYGLDFRLEQGRPIEEACVLEVNSHPAVSHLARAGHRERALESRMRLVAAVADGSK